GGTLSLRRCGMSDPLLRCLPFLVSRSLLNLATFSWSGSFEGLPTLQVELVAPSVRVCQITAFVTVERRASFALEWTADETWISATRVRSPGIDIPRVSV